MADSQSFETHESSCFAIIPVLQVESCQCSDYELDEEAQHPSPLCVPEARPGSLSGSVQKAGSGPFRRPRLCGHGFMCRTEVSSRAEAGTAHLKSSNSFLQTLPEWVARSKLNMCARKGSALVYLTNSKSDPNQAASEAKVAPCTFYTCTRGDLGGKCGLQVLDFLPLATGCAVSVG